MMVLYDEFRKYFDDQEIYGVKSPLRICPIGAHSDYQDGLVTGFTLDASVDMIYSPREDGYINIRSMDFPDREYFHVNHSSEYIPGFWGTYIRGAVKSLQQDFVLKKGLNAVVSGKLPIGGLSSSAAVTTAYLKALCHVNEIPVDEIDLIRYSNWVENQFIGLKNGILDQSANILSKNNHLMVMDCQNWEYQLVPDNPELPEFEVVVVFSGITKNLMGTDFNNRVDEVRVAGWLLNEMDGKALPKLDQVKLRNIPKETYLDHKDKIPARFAKRAAHFYTEKDRVLAGVEAWRQGDLKQFGQLMFESGHSSFYQQESGIPEMETIYNILKETPGVYGARPSGAGYRGAVIGLVDPAYKASIKEKIDQVYPQKHPQIKDDYRVNFCQRDDGARFVDVEEFK